MAILALVAIPFVLPVLPAAALESFSLNYVDMVHLATAALAFGYGIHRLRHRESGRFAMFLTGAFLIWFSVRLLYVVLPGSVGTYAGDVAGDLLYLLFYLALILAAESKPHLRSGWSQTDPAHKIQVRGAAVFLLAMLGYFVLIPSTLNYSAYDTWLPSLYMYLALDVYVAFRFLYIRTSCTSPRWRRVYGLLAVVMGFWAFTDTIEALFYAGIIEIPAAGWTDLFWWAPYPLLVVAGRAIHGEIREEQEDTTGDRLPGEVSIARAIAPQVVLAFLFPALHVGLYGVGLLDVTTRAARDGLVFVCLLAMGGLVLVQQLVLERSNRVLATDLDDARTRLSQSQRMEAVGRLAGGIAHDFNNLLTAILGHAQLLLSRIPVGSPPRRDAEKIETAGRKAAGLTGQLLAFSRRQVLQPKVIDLNAIVRGVDEMLDRLIGDDIQVELRLADGAVAVRADPAQLEQVVMNLLLNARDAMPDGGVLTLITEQSPAGAPVAPGIEPGDWVVLRVRDSGTGMGDDVREQAFDPFFTTKPQGSGLGLSTVYGIVRQSEGRVAIESHTGQGTTVTIALPRVADVPAMISDEFARPGAAPERKRRCETVLLVEDEPMVRALARDVLEAQGYRVIEAGNGRQAVDLYETHADEIELLLTDIVMPSMGGIELARELRRRRPQIPVVYMSGYTDSASFRDGSLGEDEGFLGKPFSPDGLLSALQDVLDERDVDSS